ncbi:MAG: redoxin domain-containing protein [Sideroxyarcus sp.]|nr:redoxin domain-containing protein [Sideroxyarcus sp.]
MLRKVLFMPVFWAFFVFAVSPRIAVAIELEDTRAIPHIDSAGQESYRDFLTFDKHRAFAIAPGGTWAWKGSEPSAESAARNTLQTCHEESGLTCVLYALDDKVVFDTQAWSRLWGPYLNLSQAELAPVGLKRGEHFYNLAFKNASGKPVSLSDLHGKVVLLHFWGSWCHPCRNEMPELQQLHKALGNAPDIRMVLLQVQEDFGLSRRWAQQQHLNLPLHDSGVQGKAMSSLTLADGQKMLDRDIAPAFPTTYILDKHGIVVFSNVGPVSRWSQYLPLLRDVAARSGK